MIGVGIDPGLAGAVASLDADGQLLHMHDPLVMAIRVGRRTRQDDDLLAMQTLLLPHASAACSNGACATAPGWALWPRCSRCIPWGLPAAGKRSAGLLGCDKEASRQRAHPCFPTADLESKNDHGRGEAFASRTPASATSSRNPVAPRRSAAGSRLEVVRVVLGCSEWDQRRAFSCMGLLRFLSCMGLSYTRAIDAPSLEALTK